MVKCSVIIPAYNAEKSIINCLDSIVKGSDESFEIIVVNDGSTDNTCAVVSEYAKGNSAIRLINKQNGGVSSARNVGIKHASGKYIFFADSDDLVFIDTLKYMISKAEETNADLIVANHVKRFVNVKRDEISRCALPFETSLGEEYVKKEIFPKIFNGQAHDLASLCDKLYFREIVVKNGLAIDERRTHGEDWAFNIDYLKHVKLLFVVDKEVFVYSLDGTQNYAKYSKGLAYSLIDGHKKAEELNEQYVGYKKDSVEYAKFKGRFAEQTIAYLTLKECARKEKKQYLKDKIVKDSFKYLRKLDTDKLREAGFSRRDKFAFMLLNFGAYKLALKILRRK